jgi:hypothetical protein
MRCVQQGQDDDDKAALEAGVWIGPAAGVA